MVAHDEESRLQSWLRIGTTFNEGGHHTKAIVAFEQAYRRGKEAWILGLIGQAAFEAGRYGEAAQLFRGALESMPGNPEYRAGLEAARARLSEQDRELAIS
jgi:cytochrome c-type biogenesis protein CcmH/NrfG